ncbi:MAG TPA: hypothetical protein DDY78_00520 [Planctomycetales bacterium]|nr:hypothetical protein [Planctomycetales bacterium]
MKTGFYLGVTALAVGLLAGGFLMGDDKKPDEPTKLKGKLPAHYKKLGLSDKQMQEIFKIEAGYVDRVEALQKQLADLKKTEHNDVVNVLTDEQKTHLKELLTADVGGKDKEVIVKDKAKEVTVDKDKTKVEVKDKPVIVDKDKGPPAKDKEKDK